VARKPIHDLDAYQRQLAGRLDPLGAALQSITDAVRHSPRRIVFAEGEEERSIRAALAFRNAGFGTPILVGREEVVREQMAAIGLSVGGLESGGLEIHNARLSTQNKRYTDFLYQRLQRRGYLYRDCQRMVNQNRNVFAACMVALGDADGMLTGTTRSFPVSYEDIRRAIDPRRGRSVFGLSIVVARGHTVLIADTQVHERPTPAQLVDIAIQAAAKARQLGHEPRVALCSFSSFGNTRFARAGEIREAVAELDRREVDFQYDGEMAVDVALDPEVAKLYPFCRLSGPANVLIMPGLHAANIGAKLLQKLGGSTVIGPLLLGLDKPAQIAPLGSTLSELVNMAMLTAHDALV
jgi:malate dehydrogenase (oxaloacetate-decarboxylating)(NADP+)